MAKEKFNSTKVEKVKIGEIGDPSHGEELLESLIADTARREAERRNRETFEEYKERVDGEKMELPKKDKLSKQTKALLRAIGKLKIDNMFEYKTPEEVYEEFRIKIFESMKKRVGNAFELKSLDQMEMGEYSSEARTTEFNGECYYATRIDVKVKSEDGKKSRSLIFVFSPFTVSAFGVRKEFGDMGKVDKALTLALRESMKQEFGEAEYLKALKNYNKQVKEFKEKLARGEVSLW